MYRDLQSQEFMRDPTVLLAQMRGRAPLVEARVPILGKVWLTTTQAATTHILKDHQNFCVTKSNGKAVGVAWWMPHLLKRLTHNMLSSDEPEHTRLRSIVDQAFHRGSVLKLGDQVCELADTMAASLFTQDTAVDLVTAFSRPFPLAVICELLGLPKEDQTQFSRWAQGLTTVRGVVSFLLAIYRLKPMTRYIEQRIAYEREYGGSGLIYELVNTGDPDKTLSQDELVAMVFLLLLAGHETTTHLISGGVLALLSNPDQFDALRSDQVKIDLAVEECLRFVSPVQSTKPRYVRENCLVEGVELRKGELVMPLLVAANFDPEVFEKPELFDISRKPNRHVEFGTGNHFCLGHQLARLEMREALLALIRHHGELKLAVPYEDIRWNERFGLRSLKSLPVTV